jgi:uncharacterized protein YecT (DUF1311 family)
MTRTAFTSRSIRTVVGTVTFGIAAAMTLGACGSPVNTGLTPVRSTAPDDSTAPDESTAPDDSTAPDESTAEDASADQAAPAPAVAKVVATRSARPAAKKTVALKYVKIVEPFSAPGRCRTGGTTIEMTACVLKQVVDVDYTVDVLQRQQFEYGISTAERKADLRDDANWLTKRTKTCSANLTGGSNDQIIETQCLLKVSKARVAGLS